MKKYVLMLALMLLVTLCASGLAELQIVQSSCSVMKSGEYHLVYCFAKVQNVSESVVCLENGSFDLHSGEQLLATSEITRLWPYFLAPGEEGYVFDIVTFEPGEDPSFVPQVTGISYRFECLNIPGEMAGYALEPQTSLEWDEAGSLTVICRLVNPTQMDAYDPTIAFGLYTQEGAMIYAGGETLKDVGIPAGGAVLLRFPVDDSFIEQWNGYGAVPAYARVNAMFRKDED